jgi:hypothetical protein
MVTKQFETDVTEQVKALAEAQSAKKVLDPETARLIDRWFSTSFAGTELAATPERWTTLKNAVENLKSLLVTAKI